MKVFIEQSGEKKRKNIFNKRSGEFIKTVLSDLTYPYPYGYIIGTLAADGENLDCYIITDKKIKMGSIVECKAIGMVEWMEDGQEDHKILAKLPGEVHKINAGVKKKIKFFAEHFFDHTPGKKYAIKKFLNQEMAHELIKRCSTKEKSVPAN